MIMRSETIGDLAKALAAAQAEMKPAELNSVNPFLGARYADLGAIIATVKEPLHRHGLAFSQLVSNDGDRITLTTLLAHESGEWLACSLGLPLDQEKGRPIAQSLGAIITYLRRYTLAAMLGVYAGDDDTGAAPGAKASRMTRQPPPMSLDEAMEIASSDGTRYGDMSIEQLTHVLEGIARTLAKGGLNQERRSELLRKQQAAQTILQHRKQGQETRS